MFFKMFLSIALFTLSAHLYGEHGVSGSVFISRTEPSSSSSSVAPIRTIMTFHSDGTVMTAASDAEGMPNPDGYAPFGAGQGYWKQKKCRLELKYIDFSYPKYFTTDWPEGYLDGQGEQNIALVTVKAKRAGKSKWKGKVYLTFFPITGDVNNPNDMIGEPTFVGDILLVPVDR